MAYDKRALARATNGQYYNSLKYPSLHSTLKSQDVQLFWDPSYPENIELILHKWNTKHFFSHNAQIALCQAFSDPLTCDPLTSWFALYLFSSEKPLPPAEGNYYDTLPMGVWLLDIFDFSPPSTVGDPPLDTEGPSAGRTWSGARKISLLSSNLDIPVSSGTSEKGLSTLSPLL